MIDLLICELCALKRDYRYVAHHYVTVTEAGGKLKCLTNFLNALLKSGDILRKNIHDMIIGDKVCIIVLLSFHI